MSINWKYLLAPALIWILNCNAIYAQSSKLAGLTSKTHQALFQENKGQIANQHHKVRRDVTFSGHVDGMQFFLRKNGISFQTKEMKSHNTSSEVRAVKDPMAPDVERDTISFFRTDLTWIGCKRKVKIEASKPSSNYANFYLAQCPKGATNVRSYHTVTYQNVYEGIDVRFYERNGRLEYDYIVFPSGNPDQIKVRVDGSDSISIDQSGNLIIHTPQANIIQEKPIAFQGETMIAADWKFNKNVVWIELNDYDPSLPLIIDPIARSWGTYFGGESTEGVSDVQIIGESIYLVGHTRSTSNIATSGGHQTIWVGDSDGYMAQFDRDGNLNWSTYYGGSDLDYIRTCTRGGTALYCIGETESESGIATSDALQTSNAGQRDFFIVSFDSTGTRLWSTYYGGDRMEHSSWCTWKENALYVVGSTSSDDGVATSEGYNSEYHGAADILMLKLTAEGGLLWGSYFGGSGNDHAIIAGISENSIYISGWTYSPEGIATEGAYQTELGGNTDAFLARFNLDGVPIWSTYFGDVGYDYGWCSALDEDALYLAGPTSSTSNIATSNAYQANLAGLYDNFIARFDTNGTLVWSTYHGGVGDETARWCGANGSGVYITGTTTTEDLADSCAWQSGYSGSQYDLFAVKFSAGGYKEWDSYIGGEGTEWMLVGTVDQASLVLAGNTSSDANIATPNAYQVSRTGGMDAFVMSFELEEEHIDTVLACDSLTWLNGQTYHDDNDTTIAVFSGANGCDSIVKLNLDIYHSEEFFSKRVCDSLEWLDGKTYYSSNNDITYSYLNPAGCSTVVHLDLEVQMTVFEKVFETHCAAIIDFDGITISSDTLIRDTFERAGRCDSIVSTSITLNPLSTHIEKRNDTLVAFPDGLKYRWMECNQGCVVIDRESRRWLQVQEPGLYAVIAERGGCYDTASYFIPSDTVMIDSTCKPIIPNVMTPNSDDLNDLFLIGIQCATDAFDLRVYSRWGVELFQTSDPRKGWGGSFKGELVPEGTYYYVLSYHLKSEGGEADRVFRGALTVIR